MKKRFQAFAFKFNLYTYVVAGGKLRFCEELEKIEGLKDREPGALLTTVEGWLRTEAAIKKEELAKRGIVKKKVYEYSRNSGWASGRTTATVSFGPELGMKHVGIKGSSNTVMRG